VRTISSNSTCSIWRGFFVQQVVRFLVQLWICCTAFQLVVNKSQATLHWFDLLWICCWVHNKSTTFWHVEMLWICCGLVEKLWICYGFSCTANPQQIEQMEFEQYSSATDGLTSHSSAPILERQSAVWFLPSDPPWFIFELHAMPMPSEIPWKFLEDSLRKVNGLWSDIAE
jgi:hypothetical protein